MHLLLPPQKNDHYSSARPVCTYQEDTTTAHIRVFTDKSQQGTPENYHVGTPRLEDMDDEISSLRVWSGIWELYQHADFEGNRLVVKAPDQKDVKNDYYGSLRPVCDCVYDMLSFRNSGFHDLGFPQQKITENPRQSLVCLHFPANY